MVSSTPAAMFHLLRTPSGHQEGNVSWLGKEKTLHFKIIHSFPFDFIKPLIPITLSKDSKPYLVDEYVAARSVSANRAAGYMIAYGVAALSCNIELSFDLAIRMFILG